jgi:hypothetical protein
MSILQAAGLVEPDKRTLFDEVTPRSPDLTPCDLFLWGHIKDLVYLPPLPRDVDELSRRILEAAVSVTADMLERVWRETYHRIDVRRVTKGEHIECL